MSRYALHNMNKRTNRVLTNLSSTISETFESFAFMIIGISVFGFSYPIEKIGALTLLVNFLILLVARFINIFTVSFFINVCRIKRISNNFKAMMWLSGLRGAMAFAIAISNSSNRYGYVFLSMTILFAVITIYVFGGIIPFAMRWLKVDKLNPGFDTRKRESAMKKKVINGEKKVYEFFVNKQYGRRKRATDDE